MPLSTPTLHTSRLLLRPFRDCDAEALYALHTNPKVMRYWDAPPWTERQRAVTFLAACKQMEEQGSGARLAIEMKASGSFVGWCAGFSWTTDHRSLGIGYCLSESAWGQGVATEAVHALLGWAFGALDLNRVEARLDTRNLASSRVLEKLGFSREGTLREDCIVSGEVSDSWVYGLLRREWVATKPGGHR